MLAEAARTDPDVQFLGVDTLDSRDGAERFIAEQAVPFPSLFDPDARDPDRPRAASACR